MSALLSVPPKPTAMTSPDDFLLAERRIAAEHPLEIDLYTALDEAAQRLVAADAFSMCFVRRNPDGLHFVYHREGGRFGKPEPFAFGDSPASRVARTGRPLVLQPAEGRAAPGSNPAADPTLCAREGIKAPSLAP